MIERRDDCEFVTTLDKPAVAMAIMTRGDADIIRAFHADGTITDVDAATGIHLTKGDA
jgi:hypothetical protein